MAEIPLFRKVDWITLERERAEFFSDLTKMTADYKMEIALAKRLVEQYHYLKPIRLIFGWVLYPKWKKPENAPSLKETPPRKYYYSHHY